MIISDIRTYLLSVPFAVPPKTGFLDLENIDLLIVEIESKSGVENIESILSNKQIDGVMIGPYDLSGSYGYPGDISHELVVNASKKVIDACQKYNCPPLVFESRD